MTPEEVTAFVNNGRSSLTTLAMGGDQLEKYANAFEARGGATVFGDDALQIVLLSNDFQEWLTPERLAIINRYRTDV